MDDELEAMKPAGAVAEMERWNREDLEAYISTMKAEISRVEAILAQKQDVNAAAVALFGGASDKE